MHLCAGAFCFKKLCEGGGGSRGTVNWSEL